MPSTILDCSSGTEWEHPIGEAESRSMVSGSRSVGPPLPMARLPVSATVSSGVKDILPLSDVEEGELQYQLLPPFFLSLPLPLRLFLGRPRDTEKGFSEPLLELADWAGASSFDVDFWTLAGRPDPEVPELPFAGEDRLFPPEVE